MTTLFGQPIEPDFDIGKEERNARGKKVLWVGFLLLLAYGLFRTVTVEVIQAYMATGAFYGLLFYVKWGDHLKNWWLWKAIAVSVPMHVAYLGLLFWSDAAFPQSMTKTLLFTPVLIVGCAFEFALMDAIIGLSSLARMASRLHRCRKSDLGPGLGSLRVPHARFVSVGLFLTTDVL